MIFYSKISANHTKEDAEKIFFEHGASDIIFDDSVAQKSPQGIFKKTKETLLKTKETFVVDTIYSLGKNPREISNELQWFKNNNVRIIILDIPSTTKEVESPLTILLEVYANLALVEINNVKTQQKTGIAKARTEMKHLGRKKTPYPKNWAQTYFLWKNKKISISEFMSLTGLKKGTLYNLIKQYKEQELAEKEA